MKRKHRRQIVVRPDSDSRIYVDRRGSWPSFDWTNLLIQIAIGIAGLWFGLGLLTKLLPWLILGSVGSFFLQSLGRD